ncbi:MAG TPA: permease [Anaeromyxobacteraceae bacterium]|nr:permease [Anaeromyxobacteraceae bacterium]
MPFTALLASAFLHALWNALLKRERSPPLAVAGVLAFALLFAAAASLASDGPGFATPAALGFGLAAGVFEGLYFVTLAAALARADYGVVYTIARGGAMLLVWPAAALLLQERVATRGALGALVVGLGLSLAAGRSARHSVSRSGLAFAAACAAAIAGYHLCYDRALTVGARPIPLFAVALATAFPLVLASLRSGIALREAVACGGPSALRWGFAGFLCTGSFLLFLSGLAAAGAGVALTLRNTSVVFAQGLAFALGERPARAQLIGALLVAAGAALVAAG